MKKIYSNNSLERFYNTWRRKSNFTQQELCSFISFSPFSGESGRFSASTNVFQFYIKINYSNIMLNYPFTAYGILLAILFFIKLSIDSIVAGQTRNDPPNPSYSPVHLYTPYDLLGVGSTSFVQIPQAPQPGQLEPNPRKSVGICDRSRNSAPRCALIVVSGLRVALRGDARNGRRCGATAAGPRCLRSGRCPVQRGRNRLVTSNVPNSRCVLLQIGVFSLQSNGPTAPPLRTSGSAHS